MCFNDFYCRSVKRHIYIYHNLTILKLHIILLYFVGCDVQTRPNGQPNDGVDAGEGRRRLRRMMAYTPVEGATNYLAGRSGEGWRTRWWRGCQKFLGREVSPFLSPSACSPGVRWAGRRGGHACEDGRCQVILAGKSARPILTATAVCSRTRSRELNR